MEQQTGGIVEQPETHAARIEECERRIRTQQRILVIMLGAHVVHPFFPTDLRAHEIVVLDDRGVERVRIGGNLPDAIIGGKVTPRGENAAGVMLYDSTGQERGGYVTWDPSGNVGLTLDSRKGQVALFAAGPEAGGSRLTAVAGGEVTFQEPMATLGPDAAAAYRGALSHMSYEEVLKICKQRYAEQACIECLQN
jgi:hypothetical protein